MITTSAVAKWIKVVAFEAIKLSNWEVRGSILGQFKGGFFPDEKYG